MMSISTPRINRTNARKVAAYVGPRFDDLLAEAIDGFQPAVVLIGSYNMWLNGSGVVFLRDEYLIASYIEYMEARANE